MFFEMRALSRGSHKTFSIHKCREIKYLVGAAGKANLVSVCTWRGIINVCGPFKL
jgi:hypothetical protein